MSIFFILVALLIFGMLIAVHELGHFLAAKVCGVQVNEFAIGMGPAIWKKEAGETKYALRLLPVGGYCAMEGEDEVSDNPRALMKQGFWKKFLIFVAGSAMNFLTGLIIIAVLYAGATGFYVDEITGFAPGFPLEGENGLMVGDRIYSVDGYRTYLSGDAGLYLSYNDGEGMDLVVIRNGGKVVLKDLPLYRADYTGTDGTTYRGFGIYVGAGVEEADFFVRLKYVWYTALDFVEMVRFSLVQMVTGGVGMDAIGGPVAIVGTISQVGTQAKDFDAAMQSVFYIAALIAVNLSVMNLLPIPALDGGHILFLIIDTVAWKLFKKKIPERLEMAITSVFLVLLMVFMAFVAFNDVRKLFGWGG